MKIFSAIGAIAVAAALTTAVQAADPVMATPDPVMQYASPVNFWNSGYVGVIAGGQTNFSGGTYAVGRIAGGFNAEVGSGAVLGAEVSGGYYTGTSSDYELRGTGHLGLAMNSSAMLYALAGLGVDGGSGFYTYGAGVWFAGLTDNMSARFEVNGNTYFGNSSVDWGSAEVGLFWHFD